MENLEEKIDEVKEEIIEESKGEILEVINVKEKLLEKVDKVEIGKKNEKIKKEKEKKKKQLPKKILIILVTIILVGVSGVFLYKNLPTIMKGKVESNEINIVVNYKKNLLFNKYGINVSFNAASFGSMEQGETIENVFDMPNGDYVITFTDENDVNNTASRIVTIDGSNEYTFTVKAGWKGLEVSDKVSPYEPPTIDEETAEKENEEIAEDDIAEGETEE